MCFRTAIYIPALIAPLVLLLAVLLLAVLLLVANKDAVLERVETIRGVATLDDAEDGVEGARGVGLFIEDVWEERLLVAALVLETAVAEYQLFLTELL